MQVEGGPMSHWIASSDVDGLLGALAVGRSSRIHTIPRSNDQDDLPDE
jgi:hypothetical protein